MVSSKGTVIVGMSGGVDSAVAALLLKQQGYQVKAVFMQNWEADPSDPYCTAPQDLEDAKQAAAHLKIPLGIVNFSQEYWQRVFQHFLDEYAAGRTPNPDILCNKEIKFRAFLDYAIKEAHADFIATGHYVRKAQENDQFQLLKGQDNNKDQSYFLYTLTQEQLAYSLFPIGELTKSEVRKIAQNNGLANSQKKDSTGICFIGERNFKKFLNEYLLPQPGPITTPEREIVGQHQGLMFHTLGQRKGLGIGGRQNRTEKPWYVVAKDIAHNRLIVAQQHDHPLLLAKNLTCKDVNWISGKAPQLPLSCSAKTRYRQSDQNCTILSEQNGNYYVEFLQPQRAITPGQAAVFYHGNNCLGGGTIC